MIERSLGQFLLYRPAVNPKECRKEWNEQVDFVAWIREWFPEDAALLLHPANEGDIPPQYRQDQIKAGLLKGAPDLILLRPSPAWPMGVIEMKREWWKSRATTEQHEVLSYCWSVGHFAAVCNGFQAAKVAFMDYKKMLTNRSPVNKVQIPFIERAQQ